MTDVDLVLLDCSSIQRYVFGSNKLKSNIGASFIVEKIYERWVPATLVELFGKGSPEVKIFGDWKETPAVLCIALSPGLRYETGYIGGGNALLIFLRNEQKWAEKFIQIWSRMLLLNAPGLIPAIACLPAVVSENDISRDDIDRVFVELNRNKSKYQPQTVLDRHGITAECHYTGFSAEVFFKDENEQGGSWISASAKSKLDAAYPANLALQEKYKFLLDDKSGKPFAFSNDTENLGNIEGESSLIAIVHIDGNNMGAEFQKCTGLIERRELSIKVDNKTQSAMSRTLQLLLEKMPVLDQYEMQTQNRHFFQWKDSKSGKKYLPVRPIILNGDDITFICDARISLYLAETFMKAFAEEPIDLKFGNDKKRSIKLSSCAGIAIVKSKYPFYRAYRLAEDLCSHAKRKGRVDGTSWLDFQVALTGISGDLDTLRSSYERSGYSLLWRPWQMNTDKSEESFIRLKKAMKALWNWPNNKRHELGRALEDGTEATKALLTALSSRDLKLSEWESISGLKSTGWCVRGNEGSMTPYFDVLEAMDFYPQILLEKEV